MIFQQDKGIRRKAQGINSINFIRVERINNLPKPCALSRMTKGIWVMFCSIGGLLVGGETSLKI